MTQAGPIKPASRTAFLLGLLKGWDVSLGILAAILPLRGKDCLKMEPALRKGDSKDGKDQIASGCRDSARRTWVKGALTSNS